MSEVASTKGRRRGRVPALLAVVVASVLVLAGLDRALKQGGAAGLCPAQTAWIAAAEDVPAFLDGMSKTAVAQRLAGQCPPPFDELDFLFQAMVGFPLTPARWRLWFGPRMTASQTTQGRGICVRPGLLMRASQEIRRAFPGGSDPDGIYARRSVFYAWRDGYMIVSRSHGYVADALAGEPTACRMPAGAEPSAEVRVEWNGRRPGMARVTARDGMPVCGWIEGHIEGRGRPLTLADAWPDAPMLAVAAGRWDDVAAVLSWLGDASNEVPGVAETRGVAQGLWRHRNWDTLPEDWDAAVDECALAITGIDIEQALPVPEVALVLRQRGPARGPHPLAPLAASMGSVPYEWHEHPGMVATMMGEKAALCLAQYGSDWVAASREPLMASLARGLRPAEPADADMTVRLNWDRLAAAAEAVVRRAAALELLPRMNEADAEARVMPLVRAAALLGHLRLDLQADGERVAFTGLLAGS